MKRAAIFLGVLAMAGIGGCSAKKVYPEADLGWHDAGHTVIFGTLQRVLGRQGDPPIWVIRYSAKNDVYGGELALTPPEQLVGYSGGEKVELRGEVHPELSYADYPGKWFAIRSIRMWSARR